MSPNDPNIIGLNEEIQKALEANQLKNQEKDRGVDLSTSEVTSKVTSESIPENTPQVPDLPNLSQSQIQKGYEDLSKMSPENLQRMAESFKSMDPRVMENIFKAQGVNMSAEQISKMSEMLTPETIGQIQNMVGTGATPGNPTQMMANPNMQKMLSQVVASQLGRNPEEIEPLIGCLQKLLNFFTKAAGVYRSLTCGSRKYLTGAAVAGLFAWYFEWL